MNIPNLLSLSRIFLLPLFLYLLFHPNPWMKFAALVVFGLASLTDLLDGWSARKLNLESELGKFLDPFADKVLVIATLISFLLLDPLIPLWMIIIIISRDVLITALRYVAVKKGRSIRTSRFGKWKTAFQMVSIVIIIMVFIVRSTGLDLSHQFNTDSYVKLNVVYDLLMSDHKYKYIIVTPYILMLIVTIMTAWSGLRYLFTNYKVIFPLKGEKENND
ncbi:MAG: CDP-diacylglycerol--glycerol-3-phosphate 3-phosphatidyltransferase [Spirochaetes bacterium]|nr:CDP-diacylglycerol--glycerol-3-phosphate 3-phosphatidyltransferase [Spirochaetota bacterium]